MYLIILIFLLQMYSLVIVDRCTRICNAFKLQYLKSDLLVFLMKPTLGAVALVVSHDPVHITEPNIVMVNMDLERITILELGDIILIS